MATNPTFENPEQERQARIEHARIEQERHARIEQDFFSDDVWKDSNSNLAAELAFPKPNRDPARDPRSESPTPSTRSIRSLLPKNPFKRSPAPAGPGKPSPLSQSHSAVENGPHTSPGHAPQTQKSSASPHQGSSQPSDGNTNSNHGAPHAGPAAGVSSAPNDSRSKSSSRFMKIFRPSKKS